MKRLIIIFSLGVLMTSCATGKIVQSDESFDELESTADNNTNTGHHITVK